MNLYPALKAKMGTLGILRRQDADEGSRRGSGIRVRDIRKQDAGRCDSTLARRQPLEKGDRAVPRKTGRQILFVHRRCCFGRQSHVRAGRYRQRSQVLSVESRAGFQRCSWSADVRRWPAVLCAGRPASAEGCQDPDGTERTGCSRDAGRIPRGGDIRHH